MKVHITTKNEKSIENYTRVEIDDGLHTVSTLSDNECEFILASGTLDIIPTNSIQAFLMLLRKKLRLGGTIIVGGTDIRMFAKAIINSIIGETEASDLVSSRASMVHMSYVANILTNLGLLIQTSSINGINYEIKCVRQD